MAKFNYRMQNILNVKYKLETQAKTAYSIAAGKLAEEEHKLRVIRQRQAGYEDRARELVSDRLNIIDIKYCREAIQSMKDAAQNQIVQVHVAQRNVESARQYLSEVMIERKTHEKLREKAFDEFKRELEAEESKAVDELVSYTYQTPGKK